MTTAADALRWAEGVGALDGIRQVVAEAPPIPDAAVDLLRRVDLPIELDEAAERKRRG
jgi:hypothetical protein